MTPTVVDPNVTAGETEQFTYAITSEPPADQGSASVANGELIWTPSTDTAFAGGTNFSFTVTDKGGATVTGTATVTVAPFTPVAPTNVVRDQGHAHR